MSSKAFCVLALFCGCVFGQTTTGTLLGTVADPGDAAVPKAQVELRNMATGAVTTTTTEAEGIFRFNSLVPATYTLTIRASAGFKAYSQSNIEVTANEVRDLGKISLTIGALTEQISVTATTTLTQTASSENSKLIDQNQMANITLKGRDLFGIMLTLPGVSLTSTGQADTTSENTIGRVRINGATGASANFTVDGVTNLDTGSNGTSHFEPNMDSIAEMRVLTSNYQAEYGRNSNGVISVVTKGGGRDFHGSAWANKRHEMFNAKSFFANYNGQQKSVYRFFVWGYSIGGPVYIPKLFNTERKKLFFFFSQEYTKQKPATLSGYANMPTAAQRAGDFSGYTDANGVPFSLTDPTTGNPVPGNNIAGLMALNPAAAKAGQAILNAMPLPNICGQPGVSATGCIQDAQFGSQRYQRNYYWQYNETHPRRNDTVRVDYNPTSKLTSWARYINDYDVDTTGSFDLKNSQGQFAPFAIDHPNPGHGYAVGITYTISPTMVNEFTFGKSYNTWDYYAHDQSQIDRSTMGNPPSFDNFATDPKFLADQNKARGGGLSPGSQNLQIGIPNVSFGGGQEPNEASFADPCSGQCPYTNWNDIYSFNDTVSKAWGKHNIKAGLYYERTGKVEQNQATGAGSYLGAYSFASSTAMPNNTQDGYANAFLGDFNSYTEGGRIVGNYWYTDIEAFVQDNWRVSRRVTLDYGIRFYHQLPTQNLDYNTTDWVRSSYNPAQAMRLYYPGCTASTATKACPTANQIAVDPKTGYTTFFALQGTFVPASVGGYSTTPTPFPGMERATANNPNLPLTLWNVQSVLPAVRFGVAWDVFGNGGTVVRTGFGQFYNLGSTQIAQNSSGNPPDTYNRAVYYSTVDKIPSFANTAAITPIAPVGTVGDQKVQGNYNGSFMIQQRVGFGTVLEAAYVFNLSKHIPVIHQVNAIPMYAEYNPANFNPNVAYLPANTSGKNLNDNYFRPLAGLGALTYNDYSGNASYNSLQVTVRRNFTKRLSYGLAYTWSKTMMASTTISPYFTDKFRNYGPSYQPTPHVIVANYVYEVPNLGQKLNLKPLGWVTDHWAVSGITQWHSDIRVAVPAISFSGTTSTNPQMNWTGSFEGARMLVVGNPQLASGQVSFAGNTPLVQSPGANANGTPGNQILNESVFVIPNPCSWTPGATPQQGVGQSMSCFGNAGPGSLIPIPGTRLFNFDMTVSKAFPLRSEKRQILFRAEMYNIFNRTQFTAANIAPQYNWPLWQTGVLQQTNASLGRYTSAANPRQMSMSVRLQF
jgi:Carboxypeptidase regulatory-like domain/TonB-dependent Receptor Plug Domain